MNPIEQVRQRLDERGWTKGSLADEHGVCLVGATLASVAVNRHAVRLALLTAAAEQFPERCQSHSLSAFNDHNLTVRADIDLTLDKASIAWDEAVR